MAVSRDILLKMIDDRALKHDFAGTTLVIPSAGDEVRVIRGRQVGAVLEVVAVRGHAYSAAQKVYVADGGERPVWYYPWDVEIVR